MLTAGKLDWVQHASGQCTSSHLIQQGDTLQNLAVHYLATADYSQLLAAKPWIKDPSAIVAGTHLNIPPCSTSLGEACCTASRNLPAARAGAAGVHPVLPGQT